MTSNVLSARALPAFDSRTDLPIAVVVGAGGMSMSIAQRLGQSHRVVLVSLRADELQAGQARLHEMGVVNATLACDITDSNSVQALGEAIARLGTVQTLAHVAALSPVAGNGETILAVNLIGAARIETTLQPLMARGGAAIFISSLAAHGPDLEPAVQAVLDAPLADDLFAKLAAVLPQPLNPGLGYSLAKTSLNRMVRRRAAAWGKRGARIVSLSPGLIDTVMGAAENAHSSSKTAMRAKLPLVRDGTMADIADAVEFLASSRASYISGIDLLVDGGLAAALRFPDTP